MTLVAWRHRGNGYGIRWMPTWPHVSLGVSAHLGSRFAHLSLHLPVGVMIVGCVGADEPEAT